MGWANEALAPFCKHYWAFLGEEGMIKYEGVVLASAVVVLSDVLDPSFHKISLDLYWSGLVPRAKTSGPKYPPIPTHPFGLDWTGLTPSLVPHDCRGDTWSRVQNYCKKWFLVSTLGRRPNCACSIQFYFNLFVWSDFGPLFLVKLSNQVAKEYLLNLKLHLIQLF